MANGRNHRLALGLMKASISQRGVALSGREMRVALEAHRFSDGLQVHPCVVDEFEHWAEHERKALEHKDALNKRRAEVQAARKKLKDDREAQAARETAAFMDALRPEPFHVQAIRWASRAALSVARPLRRFARGG